MITLSQAQREDASELLSLELSIFKPSDPPLSKRAFLYHIKKNLLLVAKDNGKLAGYILVLTPQKRETARLYSIAVLKEYRSQKIANRLMIQAFTLLRDRYKKVTLEVRKSNSVIGWYQHLGFKILNELPLYYEDEDGYKMVLNLEH